MLLKMTDSNSWWFGGCIVSVKLFDGRLDEPLVECDGIFHIGNSGNRINRVTGGVVVDSPDFGADCLSPIPSDRSVNSRCLCSQSLFTPMSSPGFRRFISESQLG